jgi:hypothetical protein
MPVKSASEGAAIPNPTADAIPKAASMNVNLVRSFLLRGFLAGALIGQPIGEGGNGTRWIS